MHETCSVSSYDTSQDISDWLRRKHRARTQRLEEAKDRKQGKKVALEDEVEVEVEVESDEARQLREALEKMHTQLEAQAKKRTAGLELRVVKELRRLASKHEAWQAQRAELQRARGGKDTCKAPSAAARPQSTSVAIEGGGHDGGYDSGYFKPCKSSGVWGGNKGKRCSGCTSSLSTRSNQGSLVHASPDKGKGSASLQRMMGSRSAERRAKCPVPGEPGEPRIPERAMSTENPSRRAHDTSSSSLGVGRDNSPPEGRGGGNDGGDGSAAGGAAGGVTGDVTSGEAGGTASGAAGGVPSCGAKGLCSANLVRDSRGGASRSHPGQSYEREWSKVRSVAKATTSPARRHSSVAAGAPRAAAPAAPRRHSIDNDFVC